MKPVAIYNSDVYFKQVFRPKDLKKTIISNVPFPNVWENTLEKTPEVDLFGAVTWVDFNPVEPHDFAATASLKVVLFDPYNNQPQSVLSSFKDVAYSGNFRDDGQLLVAGCHNGNVCAFNTANKKIIREFQSTASATRFTMFADKTLIISGSDDQMVRVWDLPTGKLTQELKGHTDSIRCGLGDTKNKNLFITGSYDHNLIIWDYRAPKLVRTINHGSPVEDVEMVGPKIYSAGGQDICTWDIRTNRRSEKMGEHQKTITQIVYDKTRKKLLSASLDNMVKVYDDKLKPVHTINYPAPILSMSISPLGTHLVVGMANGQISIRAKRPNYVKADGTSNNEAMEIDQLEGEGKAAGLQPTFKKQKQKISKLQKSEEEKLISHYLKKFKYNECLDYVLNTKNIALITSVFEEFIERDALWVPFSTRNEETLVPLLQYFEKNIAHPEYTFINLQAFNLLLDIYSTVIGLSPKIDRLFIDIQTKINNEIKLKKELIQLLGTFEMISNTCKQVTNT